MKPPAAFKLLEALCLSWLLFPGNCILFRVEMFFTHPPENFFCSEFEPHCAQTRCILLIPRPGAGLGVGSFIVEKNFDAIVLSCFENHLPQSCIL